MRRRLKRAARVALKAASVATDPLFGPFPGPRNLIYHQVGVDFGREMEVSTEEFTRQVNWMQANGEIVDLETAIERRGAPDANKLYVLTFDDGFEDVYYSAFPLMKEREIPFTLYLTTRPIETREPLDSRYPDARPLTWDHVADMAASGLATVGAHTHSHPNFRLIATDQIALELATSNGLIRDRTGIDPKHFTYPWGLWAHHADPLVREHYESATIGSQTSKHQVDVFRLARLPIQRSDNAWTFGSRMSHGLRLEALARGARDRLQR